MNRHAYTFDTIYHQLTLNVVSEEVLSHRFRLKHLLELHDLNCSEICSSCVVRKQRAFQSALSSSRLCPVHTARCHLVDAVLQNTWKTTHVITHPVYLQIALLGLHLTAASHVSRANKIPEFSLCGEARFGRKFQIHFNLRERLDDKWVLGIINMELKCKAVASMRAAVKRKKRGGWGVERNGDGAQELRKEEGRD